MGSSAIEYHKARFAGALSILACPVRLQPRRHQLRPTHTSSSLHPHPLISGASLRPHRRLQPRRRQRHVAVLVRRHHPRYVEVLRVPVQDLAKVDGAAGRAVGDAAGRVVGWGG
jgi:hypothetical protein